jgi:hypothetical protein
MKPEELKQIAEQATPQNLDTAEQIEKYSGEAVIDCPCCDGEGYLDLEADYCNYDGKAIGVQFYGVGATHGAAERYVRTLNPELALKLCALWEAVGFFKENGHSAHLMYQALKALEDHQS